MEDEKVSGAATQDSGARDPNSAGEVDALNGDAGASSAAAIEAALNEPNAERESRIEEEDGKADAAAGKQSGEASPEKALDGLNPETRARIQERFDELTRKRREAEERAEAEAAKAREANERARAAEERLAARAADALNMPKVMLAESETEIAEREATLERYVDTLEDWLEGHGPEDEFEEGGKTYSFADVKRALRGFRRELTRVIPAARTALAARVAAREKAEKLYPDVMKKGTEANAEAERILAIIPGLRAVPDWPVWVGRMIAGKNAEGRTQNAESVRPQKTEGKTSVPPKPPAVPAAGSRIPSGDSAQKFDAKRVRESSDMEDAFADELAKML